MAKFKNFETYLKDVLLNYGDYNEKTGKWEIWFDDLVEMGKFYLDKYWDAEIEKARKKVETK